MHQDIICHGIPLDPAKGIAATMALLDGFLAAEEIDWSLEHIAAQGSVVLTERVDRFRFNKDADWTAVRAMGVFEIGADGLIHAWRDYFDKEEFAARPIPKRRLERWVMCIHCFPRSFFGQNQLDQSRLPP